MTSRTNPWARWRVRLGYPVAIAFALLAQPTSRSLLIGSGIAMMGLLIRAAAAGHLRKHQELATSGPYRYTRNPLYFGSALLAAGMLVAGASWHAAAIVSLYFLAFYPQVMLKEAEELRALYGVDYEAYAARVPLFFPSLAARSTASQRFSWGQYRANREYQATIGFLIGIALLYAKMKWMP